MSAKGLFRMLLLLGLIVLVGCAGVAWSAEQMTFYVIAHAGPGDPFWAVVQRGVVDAGKALGVRAIFEGPSGGAIVAEQVNMFNAALAARPSGIATTLSDPRAWVEPLRDARARGIPVVVINVKEPAGFPEELPYLSYIGQDEYDAGRVIGKKVAAKLSKGARVVVAIHHPGHVGLEARAQGITDVLTAALDAKVSKLDITTDPTKALAILRSFLQINPDTAAIFTLGPLGTIPTVKLLEEQNLGGKIKVGSFDLDPVTVSAIKKGFVEATVDQQQYLQGYMAVVQLYLYARYKLMPDDINTGRGLVDITTVSDVEELVKQGVR